jgi:hypothetical protein
MPPFNNMILFKVKPESKNKELTNAEKYRDISGSKRGVERFEFTERNTK